MWQVKWNLMLSLIERITASLFSNYGLRTMIFSVFLILFQFKKTYKHKCSNEMWLHALQYFIIYNFKIFFKIYKTKCVLCSVSIIYCRLCHGICKIEYLVRISSMSPATSSKRLILYCGMVLVKIVDLLCEFQLLFCCFSASVVVILF